MLFIFLYRNFFGQIIGDPVHAHTRKARLARAVEHLLVFALSAAHNGRKQLDLAACLIRQHLVHNLVNGLLADLSAANRAVRHADTGIEQTQVVIDLGDGAHGGTRIFGGGLLVDGDSRRKPLDALHVRLVHLSQKHARIAGQALHIAALTLGVDRVERQ